MSGGAWLDLTLLALLAATLVLLYRLRPQGTLLAAEAAGAPPPGFLRSRFPAVARQAGFDPDRLRWFYWLAKLALAAGLPLLLLELWLPLGLPAPPVALAVFALLGFFLPDLWLLLRRRQRRQRIQHALSYFLDLLVALLHSGLGLEEAFRRAGREGLPPSHPLAEEVGLVSLELEAGEERAAAFGALADRTGVPEVRAVAAALRLAVRHGTSVETALETQAELLRTKQREKARAEVTAAVTKAIFPLFLCGFPIFLVIVFFPAILEIVETVRALAGAFF